MSEIQYELINNIGVLSKSASGWAKTPIVPLRGTLPPIQRADLGEEVQPDQLERPRAQIRPARLVRRSREDGQGRDADEGRAVRVEGFIEYNGIVDFIWRAFILRMY
jgi:hypothetical protein